MDDIKSKLQAIVNIINEMDDMELSKMTESEEEMSPEKVTMVSIKAKPEMEMEEEMPESESEKMPEEEMAETETEEEPIDESTVLGRLRKRLQGA